MTYPATPDKWREPSLHGAEQFIEGVKAIGWDPGPVPKGAVFVFDPRLRDSLGDRPEAEEDARLAPGNARVFRLGTVIVSCLSPGAGAMVTQMENLAYLGTSSFVICGTAGSIRSDLAPGSIVVADRALRDDGVSQHYLAPARCVDASARLTDNLAASLPKARRGATWTMPVPYRVTRRELETYAADGVLTIEMEAASLFAAAQARGVAAAAVLVVTGITTPDERREDWSATTEPLAVAFDAALAAVGGR